MWCSTKGTWVNTYGWRTSCLKEGRWVGGWEDWCVKEVRMWCFAKEMRVNTCGWRTSCRKEEWVGGWVDCRYDQSKAKQHGSFSSLSSRLSGSVCPFSSSFSSLWAACVLLLVGWLVGWEKRCLYRHAHTYSHLSPPSPPLSSLYGYTPTSLVLLFLLLLLPARHVWIERKKRTRSSFLDHVSYR